MTAGLMCPTVSPGLPGLKGCKTIDCCCWKHEHCSLTVSSVTV